MKNKLVKVLCLGMSAAMIFTMPGCNTQKNTANTEEIVVETDSEIIESENNYLGASGEVAQTEDGDTLYVISDASGKVSKLIKSAKVEKNGEEIYEQEEMKEDPPVDVKATYYLDGKEIAPASLAGKSGKVTIRFDYTNNTKVPVTKDGVEETYKIPYTMMTTVILPKEHFSNVEVKNAKIVDDGTRSLVVGYAFPGLTENLALEEELINIPEYVEITADATDFELESILTIATNELFAVTDEDGEEKIDQLEADLNEDMEGLEEALYKLESGAGDVYDGMTTLEGKAGELQVGVKQLSDGAENLKNGLDQLKANNAALIDGATKVFDSLLASANKALADAGIEGVTLTKENYAATLDTLIASMDQSNVYAKAKAKVEEAVEAQGDEVYTSYLKTRADDIYASYVTAQIATQMGEIWGTLSEEEQAEYIQAGVAGLTEEQKNGIIAGAAAKLSDEEKAAIKAGVVEQQLADSEEVKQAVAKAGAGAESLASLKDQLNSYNTFYTGLIAYTAGVAAADDGAAKLADGAEKLNANIPALLEGISALKDGTKMLSDGIRTFDTEGISKLTGIKEDKLDKVSDRIAILREISGDSKEGKVIYRLDGIQ